MQFFIGIKKENIEVDWSQKKLVRQRSSRLLSHEHSPGVDVNCLLNVLPVFINTANNILFAVTSTLRIYLPFTGACKLQFYLRNL